MEMMLLSGIPFDVMDVSADMEDEMGIMKKRSG